MRGDLGRLKRIVLALRATIRNSIDVSTRILAIGEALGRPLARLTCVNPERWPSLKKGAADGWAIVVDLRDAD